MWLWFKRYRTLVSFILSPQGFKSTIYMAWLRLFRSHFAVYYRGPTLCCFTRFPLVRRRIFFPPIILLIAWQNYFSHNLITFGQWVAIVPVKMWSYFDWRTFMSINQATQVTCVNLLLVSDDSLYWFRLAILMCTLCSYEGQSRTDYNF